jgi:hypothetical protein
MLWSRLPTFPVCSPCGSRCSGIANAGITIFWENRIYCRRPCCTGHWLFLWYTAALCRQILCGSVWCDAACEYLCWCVTRRQNGPGRFSETYPHGALLHTSTHIHSVWPSCSSLIPLEAAIANDTKTLEQLQRRMKPHPGSYVSDAHCETLWNKKNLFRVPEQWNSFFRM